MSRFLWFTVYIHLSYIGSVTARHSSSGCQPNFVAWYEEWNYETFTHGATYIRQGGHHVGYRPTFQVLFFDTSCDICAVSTLEHDTYFMLLSRTAAVYECVCLYAMQA